MRFSHCTIQFSGSVLKSPSWPMRAVKEKRRENVAGVVPGWPLRLKLRLKS